MPIMASYLRNVYYETNIIDIASKYDVIASTAPLTKVTNSMLNYSFYENEDRLYFYKCF